MPKRADLRCGPPVLGRMTMGARIGLFLLSLLLCRAAPENSGPADLAARVVILANDNDPDSLRIARHYAEARAVPETNIIALKMPLSEGIAWGEFITTIWSPLLEQLVTNHWIDAIRMSALDSVGRPKYAPEGHRIAALVVCRGVPLKIAHDPALYTEARPFTDRDQFRTNEGAVDAELSLLAVPNYPINGFLPNPLFQNDRPTEFQRAEVVKVSRLDGPTVGDALALVDHAIQAERTGLLGRGYVDLSDRDPVGNIWLEAAAKNLEELGFDCSVDREPGTFPNTARIDAPAVYFGWYAGDLNGPFALPGFRFPPGAIAIHIHSYTAATLHSASSGWTGPLVARGITATVGNVHEPYLQFTHRPQLLLRALARGETLVDATYYSLPALSWQAILIGDPLYRPFAVPLDQQLKAAEHDGSPLASYAVLRRIRLLDAAGQQTEATALARSAMRTSPSLALGFELAQRLAADGEKESAANVLGFAARLKFFPTDEWALAREAAALLSRCGRPTAALDVWRTLLAIDAMPPPVRVAWLPDAIAAARAANEPAAAAKWQGQLTELTAPEKK